MEIRPTDSSELANHPYIEIEPGTYHTSGRVLIVSSDDSALLILVEPAQQ